MKRTEWLIKLEQELTRLGVAGPREVVADYEEHFSIGASQGKQEEEISAKLGDPSTVARAHQAELLITKVTPPASAPGGLSPSPRMDDVLRATFRLLLLTPFNFIMLICPFLIVAILLFTGWTVTACFGVASLLMVFVAAISLPFLFVSFWSAGGALFGSLGFICMTGVAMMTMYVLTREIMKVFVAYLRWNVNFVLEKN